MSNENQSILELKSTSVLILDTRNEINSLIDLLDSHLIDLPTTIYLKDTNKKLIVPFHCYYTLAGLSDNTPLESLDDVNEDVLDSNGNVIIPAKIMLNKSNWLVTSAEPEYKIIPVIEAIVKNLFNTRIKEYHRFNARNKLKSLIKESSHYILDTGEIEDCCQSLLTKIENFIGNDTWHIYFINFVGTDLFINKTYDLRIYEWTKQQEELNGTDRNID